MDSTYHYALGSGAAALFAIPRLWDMFTKRMIEKESGFYDAERLGRQRDSVHKIPGTAVVCGGSIAGLLTARICHDHFEHVVIVESENWLDTEDARLVHSWDQQSTRSRIMQYTSIQGNLPILYKGLSHLFPNFDAECEASDIGLDAADYKLNFFGYLALAPAEHYGGQLPKTFFSSRRALETLLRRLILDPAKYPNIKQVIGTVTGLLVDSAHPEKRISAAVVRDRDGVSQQISSSLLIDCTGPTQAGTKWLQRLEYAQDLKRDTFHANMHYRTFHFHISPELGAKLPIPGGYENIGGSIIVRVPDNSRDRLYLAVSKGEGRTIAVCCGSWGIDDLPSTVDGIKELGLAIQHDQPLPSWFPPFLDMLHEAEDTMEFSSVHVGPAYWIHYERSPDLPTNFVAIGDSVSRINPIYGQGCSKALVGAMVMNTILEQHRNEPQLPNEFARTVFQSQADKIKPLWDSTKAIDYAYNTTLPMEGETLEHGWFIRWFSHKMQILAASDRQAASAMWRNVVMMDGASIEMMHPMLLLKVFWLAFFRRK